MYERRDALTKVTNNHSIWRAIMHSQAAHGTAAIQANGTPIFAG